MYVIAGNVTTKEDPFSMYNAAFGACLFGDFTTARQLLITSLVNDSPEQRTSTIITTHQHPSGDNNSVSQLTHVSNLLQSLAAEKETASEHACLVGPVNQPNALLAMALTSKLLLSNRCAHTGQRDVRKLGFRLDAHYAV